MPVRRYILRAAGLLALTVLAFLVLRPPGQPPGTVVLGERATAAAIEDVTTLRNVTDHLITYTVKPNAYTRTPLTRTLKVGAVDRIPTQVPLVIAYDNGARPTSYTVFPGRPYSFRFDEYGRVKVYPGSHGRGDAADLAPFVPTPLPIVKRMLEIARVGRDDVVYDLGCGDGRMIIEAAKNRLARGVGVDIDPDLIAQCKAGAEKEGVANRTRFICMDAMKVHVTEATVLALYLLPESLQSLRPLFEKELKPGTRIVSHNYRIPGWDDRLVFQEILPGDGERPHKIFLYVMPGGK
jgi:hypothetical protein